MLLCLGSSGRPWIDAASFARRLGDWLDTMKVQEQLEALERLAEAMSVRVSYEPMAGLVQRTGGLCRVRGEYRIIIDRRLKPPERVQILVDALQRFELGDHEIDPELRALLTPARATG